MDEKRVLVFDTNVFVHLADYDRTGSQKGKAASDVARAASMLGYTVTMSSASLDELQNSRVGAPERLRAAERYPILEVRGVGDLAERAGFPSPMSDNDARDLEILALVDQGYAHWLVTEDDRLVSRAERAGLTSVVKLDRMRSRLLPVANPSPPPSSVALVPPTEVNTNSEFFHSLKDSYPGFLDWWQNKVLAENRTTLVIGSANDPEGLAVLKDRDPDHGLPDDTMKLCTFKVGEGSRSSARGELLLRAVVGAGRRANASCIFVEVHPDNDLIDWLQGFGFATVEGAVADNGDAVIAKHLQPTRAQERRLTPLEYNQRFGPGNLKIERLHRVPIRPEWRPILFPRPEDTTDMLPGLDQLTTRPCGRAIRKVYMSNAATRKIMPGDTLAFVESVAGREMRDFGVVEGVLVSDDPVQLATFAGSRTVYSASEITDMAHNGEVLAVKFRHDRTLDVPLTPLTTGYVEVFPAVAQSITEASEEGIEWVRAHLSA